MMHGTMSLKKGLLLLLLLLLLLFQKCQVYQHLQIIKPTICTNVLF